MSAPLLYDFALDLRCYAVRLGCSLMGKEISIRDVDVMPGGEHLSAPLLAINPKGTVPFLVDGETVLSEPAAILGHMASGSSWEPITPRAQDWLSFASNALFTFNIARHSALFSEPGSQAFDSIPVLTGLARQHLRQLDDAVSLGTLKDETFLTGDTPSLGDVLAFPVFAQSRDLRLEPEAYPALRLWARRVRALPGFIGMPGIPDYH